MHETLLRIAHSGVLAPSADNRHVFRIDFTDTAIRLWPTREFSENKDRLRHILGLMSLGAVVENMRLRAGELGYSASINWYPDESTQQIAQVELQLAPREAVDELAGAISARHTNRRMYRGPGLNDVELARFEAAISPVPNVRLIWLKGVARRNALSLIWHAESERFLRESLHKDLFSSIRFDLSWQETANYALPPGALEIEAPMRPLFKALRHWGLMKLLTRVGVHRLIGLRAGWLPCWQAPALGLLATSSPVEQGASTVGCALERLWLQATVMDLAMQPFAASAVLPLQSTADCGASDELRLALDQGWQAIAPGVTPLMIFRMGRAARPAITTSRPPLSEYFVNVA